MFTAKYATPAAFKQALEQRLKIRGGDLTRHRRILVFDRLLARIVAVFGDTVILKGGLGLEVRLKNARTTRDIDLRVSGSPLDLLERLQRAGRLDLGDHLTYEVRTNQHNPGITGEGVRYDGARFVVRCSLAGKEYGGPFGLDVAFADPMFGEPDVITADDTLGFAGLAPPVLRVYPVETHVAEKLHAYTLPRPFNSRVKDLPDIALLASSVPLSASRIHAALELTFSFRGTHPVPGTFPDPPAVWADPYARMAVQDNLPWTNLAAVTSASRDFLEPVLAGARASLWSPARWAWHGA